MVASESLPLPPREPPFTYTAAECMGKTAEQRWAMFSALMENYYGWLAQLSPEERAKWDEQYWREKQWPDPWWRNMPAEARKYFTQDHELQ